jgi:Tol biopolymer transport system component
MGAELRIVGARRMAIATMAVTACTSFAPHSPAQLAPMTRVSVDSSGTEANDITSMAWIAGDGRAVVFQSAATNLVPNDANGIWDVFVHDRTNGVTDCVSVDPNGVPGDLGGGEWFWPSPPSISADGRFVVFLSRSTNLVAGRKGKRLRLYVRDRATSTTDFVSVDGLGTQGNADSQFGTISADGRFVALQSAATNLVAGDTNQHMDVFVRDRAAGTTDRISVDASGTQGDGDSTYPFLSADGTTVAFGSLATNLVGNDPNGRCDAFVCDLATKTLERISVDPSGVEGNSDSIPSSISADGRYVALWSVATNLVPGDTNGAVDCFVRDRATGVTERVSVDSSGGESDFDSVSPFLSADGRFVAFMSFATNLVPNDANGTWDVFVHDRTTGSTTRVTLGVAGAEADDWSDLPTISADGGVVSFVSAATNLVAGDSNGWMDAFTYDLHYASWTNYGAGFPGTNGVPAFTSRAAPLVGASITLDVQNSLGQPTVGLLIAGFQRASLHSSLGGDLLVLPAYVLPISFSYGSNSFDWTIPADPGFSGVIVDLQVVEADAGAAKGASFTAGLELAVGY